MGMFQLHSPLGVPHFTVAALERLPIELPWASSLDTAATDDIWRLYLYEYGSWEFNNLSGLFVPLVDFGLAIGLMVMCVIGIVVGGFYRSYAQRQLAGLILYPTWYLGILEIIRLFYFGESRIVPVFLVAGIVGWALKSRWIRDLRVGGARRADWEIRSRRRVA